MIIGKVWPEPLSSAAGQRMMQLIELFQDRKLKIDFVCTAHRTGFEENLERLGIASHFAQVNDESFDTLLLELKPDIVLFDRFITEEQFGWRVRQQLPETLTILDSEDLHFLRKGREEAVKRKGTFEETDYFNNTTKRELASILRADLTLIISEFEMQLLIERFHLPAGKLFYLPIFLDDSIRVVPFEERSDVVFIGNFMHEPNWDAVLQLKSIWKSWTGKPKEIQLKVYGAYPPQKAYGLQSERDQFHIMGRASSSSEVIGNAKLLLAPLRFGAGLKGKLLESISLGTPSITTSVGAEGIADPEQWGGVVSDDLGAWPKLIQELFFDRDKWKMAQENGFNLLTKFRKSQYDEPFFEVLSALSSHLNWHRQQYFLGEVLHYHTLRSTEFMSRWIEEKNKA
ncbi:MAG: glycosyltransferase family 4 protein [Flavobacteriales bacterium]|nr:glycosyltransferase family 4 protein [Flavobacteriales bacterium]